MNNRLHVRRCHRWAVSDQWHSRWHTAARKSSHLLIYLLRGTAEVEVDGERFEWQSEQVLWVGQPQFARAKCVSSGQFEAFTLRFNLFISEGQLLSVPFKVRLFDGTPQYLRCLDACMHLVQERPGPLRDRRLRWTIADGMAQLFLREQQVRRQEVGLNPDQRRRIRQWLHRHWRFDPQPADLAQQLNLSSATFRRRFQQSYACSPRQWISHERLRFAAYLMGTTDRPISECAERAGYQSMSSFSRLFSREFNVSPRKWRQSFDMQKTTDQASYNALNLSSIAKDNFKNG